MRNLSILFAFIIALTTACTKDDSVNDMATNKSVTEEPKVIKEESTKDKEAEVKMEETAPIEGAGEEETSKTEAVPDSTLDVEEEESNSTQASGSNQGTS